MSKYNDIIYTKDAIKLWMLVICLLTICIIPFMGVVYVNDVYGRYWGIVGMYLWLVYVSGMSVVGVYVAEKYGLI